MVERTRRRRPEEQRDEEQPRSQTTPAANVLALQSAAGNRAVIQRLMYSGAHNQLAVPDTFGGLSAKWNDALGYVDETSESKTVRDLWDGGSQKFRKALKIGLGVDELHSLRTVPVTDLRAEAATYSDNPDDAGITKALSDSAAAHDRLFKPPLADPLDTRTKVAKAISYLPQFKDLLPGAPDLPRAGESVMDEIPGTEDERGVRKLYWTRTCVLIALYKNEGIDFTRGIIGGDEEVEDEVHTVVQKLHDKYIGAGIEYDDTATRLTVMNEWGYKMIFSGNTPWNKLSHSANFVPGKRYIVDIEGHTVKMRVKKAVPPKVDLEPVDEYFECDSDKQNYNTSEFLKKVLAVWQK
ncbi:hypothetical protein OM076_27610 [Solirubrobacter ginsenosidimutans]|uniref:Uncharacterized protein n=1 Tax=Solirubrobacter ginsenosidimutans TaxID=490573 RepID=A0A9X3S5D9_9ACTN|nr:hypothetical protein [Solirubrobacter ginsenosidimutans]MDA0164071.1 hypothetical protein [Solirubrobacter ginsenosidimutans]